MLPESLGKLLVRLAPFWATVCLLRSGCIREQPRTRLLPPWSRERVEYAGPSSLDRQGESRMNKPRIFLGSSGKQAKLLQAITRGLEDVADVEPWTTTFNPGRSTLDRLVELSPERDFAGVVFPEDDWSTTDAS